MIRALHALFYTQAKTIINEQNEENVKDFYVRRHKLRNDAKYIGQNARYLLEKNKDSRRLKLLPQRQHALEMMVLASDLIVENFANIEPPHKQEAWHQDAKLIGWHIERVLRSNGFKSPIGNDKESPLVRLTRKLLFRRVLTKDRRKFLGVCGVVGGVLQVVQQAQR